LGILVAGLVTVVSIAPVRAQSTADGAEALSPVGRWQTFDSRTHELRSIIEITRVGDELQGKVVQRTPPPGDPTHGICGACRGDLKDQPIVGMVILTHLKKDGDGWGGGTVLDPSSGKTYSAEVHLADGGRTLLLRGYEGIRLLGQTVAWVRDSAR
jgi:uncharacterized protein (DUF2147 family)